jgi:hypothetical protein
MTVKFAESFLWTRPLKPMASTYFSVDYLELKTDRLSNKLSHTESAARYKHQMQVKLKYCYTSKKIPAYGVYISQFIQYARASIMRMKMFWREVNLVTKKIVLQSYSKYRLKYIVTYTNFTVAMTWHCLQLQIIIGSPDCWIILIHFARLSFTSQVTVIFPLIDYYNNSIRPILYHP